MSFGYGVGDILAISGLAIKVYKAYKDAPEDYRHISNEVESLQAIIDKAVRHYKSSSLDNNSWQEGKKALKSCQNVLEDLNDLIEKFNTLASSNTNQVLKRVKLGNEDIATLRARLTSNTGLLNSFIQSCESREIRETQARIADALGLQRTTSRLSFTGSINTIETYKSFFKKLKQAGVTKEMISENEEEILNMFNPQNTAISGQTDDSNITGPSQLPAVTVPEDLGRAVGLFAIVAAVPCVPQDARAPLSDIIYGTLEKLQRKQKNKEDPLLAELKAITSTNKPLRETLQQAQNAINQFEEHWQIKGKDGKSVAITDIISGTANKINQ